MTAEPLDAGRDALIALQGQLITLLAAQNAALAARAARLERAASRSSENSSLPPSLDNQPGAGPRRRPEAREARAKDGSALSRPPGTGTPSGLHLNRRQTRHQRLHRPVRRAHRKRLDAANSRRRLNSARKPSHGATQANATHKQA